MLFIESSKTVVKILTYFEFIQENYDFSLAKWCFLINILYLNIEILVIWYQCAQVTKSFKV
jgi:hypothetical protein